MNANDIVFLTAIVVPMAFGGLLLSLDLKRSVWPLALLAVSTSAGLRLHLFHSDAVYELHSMFGGLFYRDTLNDMISVFYTIMLAVVLAAMPVMTRTRQQIGKLLLVLSFAMAFFHANNLYLLLSSWIGIIIVFASSFRKYVFFLAFQTAALVMFCVAVWMCREGLPTFSTTEWITHSGGIAPPGQSVWIMLAIVVSGALSQGLFPFHIGLKSVATRTDFPTLIAFVTANIGLYIVIRYGMQFGSVLPPLFSKLVAAWVLTAFVYLSVSALAVNNIRHLYIALMSIQSTLIWVGFLHSDSVGQTGSLIQWAVALIAGTGFGLCIWLFENRTGVRRLAKSTVAFDKMPRLATLFLIFGMCVVDFPGTLGFVSEDLLVHSIVESSAVSAMIVLICMAFSSIAVYRSYVALFLGRKLSAGELVVDLTSREAYAFLFVLVLLVGMGIFPTPITERALNSVNGQFHTEVSRK